MGHRPRTRRSLSQCPNAEADRLTASQTQRGTGFPSYVSSIRPIPLPGKTDEHMPREEPHRHDPQHLEPPPQTTEPLHHLRDRPLVVMERPCIEEDRDAENNEDDDDRRPPVV